MSSLRVTAEDEGKLRFVELAGVIDEDSDIAKVEAGGADVLIINAARVARINSVGVRDWVNWLEPLSAAKQIYLAECSPAVVFHANFVTNFLGKAHVVSLYAPYYCTSCDHEASLLVDADEVRRASSFEPPVCTCSECGGSMAFDDLDESYFGFLKLAPPAAPSGDVSAAIAKRSRPVGELRAKTPLAPPEETTAMTVLSTPSSSSLESATGSSSSWRGSSSGSKVELERPRTLTPAPRKGFRIEYLLVGLLLATLALVAVALLR